ncbi:hypothetical protein CAPTEDRAFT_132934 [Capitella teleta]|uniref:Sodium/hydrogen exchanger n=1 Tax=Capitella teleta TaxID=283909 RepID=R7T9E5_CAPTE|nr:hypothetical protein CAPTEDRAFT_132934 [Capitella teleta]|eukprot:ELT90348.1 hypothetical protein CAPTEDRAFT_132934 [Capitella teleta]
MDYVREPLIITLFLLVAAVCKLGFHHANFLSSILPESCLLIILGTVVGAILQRTNVAIVTLSPRLFFLFLLPPIILESAFSLHDRVFFDNLGTILIYAVIGTVINCFIIGPTLYGLAKIGAMGTIHITMVQCLVFSSLIVAVDPVAVLAIFQEIGVNNVLYFLVFGESLLNDAVTVVLYNMMKVFNEMDVIPVEQMLLGVASFFTISLLGLSIGILFGILTAIITKFTESVRVVEPLAVFALAYSAYLFAELFHFSGIISIIGCGLVQAQYSFHNISQKSLTTVTYFSKMLSSMCDCVIFMFLGLALVHDKHVWHTGFILWVNLLCFVSRFVVVYALTFVANRWYRMRTIDWEEQFIMAYGGLRGAVAFCLVAMLSKESLELRDLFETTTLSVIIFTVFIQGISIKPLVRLLRIQRKDAVAISLYQEINVHVTDHVMAGIEEIIGRHGANYFRVSRPGSASRHDRPCNVGICRRCWIALMENISNIGCSGLHKLRMIASWKCTNKLLCSAWLL